MMTGKKEALDEIEKHIADKVENVVNYCKSEIVQRGAKASGAFTANINVSINKPVWDFDKDKKSDIQTHFKVTNPFAEYYVSSGAPYALRLEHGWSKKQPIGLFNIVANAAISKYYR